MWSPSGSRCRSTRSASASSPCRAPRCSAVERLDALAAPVLRAQPVLVERERALRSASSKMRRLSPRSAWRTSTGAAAPLGQRLARAPRGPADRARHDHLRRHRRRARVVLEHELLGHLALVAAAPRSRGRSSGGRPARRRAPGTPARSRRCPRPATAIASSVPTASFEIRWRSSSERTAFSRLRRFAACSNSCALRGLAASLLEARARSGGSGREEVDDRVDVLAVLLLRDVADAGRPAALDEVVEARAAGRAARLGAVAGAVLEDLAEQVERLAHALGVRERAEVGAAAAVLLAREVDPREVLVQRDRDVGVRLVVAQPDVEARPVLADEVLLGEQRLGLGLGDDEVDPRRSASSMPARPRASPGFEKWPATRFRIERALPT